MSDYSKSRIYKIYCNIDGNDEIYVGSSKDLKQRILKHQSYYNNPKSKKYNFKVYRYIRDNFGWDNFTVKTLERFSCENQLALRQREQKWIDELKPTLNTQKAYCSPDQYIINDRKNRNKVKTCDNCGKKTTSSHYSRHRQTKYCLNYTAV
jgi:group I intron endonuclease